MLSTRPPAEKNGTANQRRKNRAEHRIASSTSDEETSSYSDTSFFDLIIRRPERRSHATNNNPLRYEEWGYEGGRYAYEDPPYDAAYWTDARPVATYSATHPPYPPYFAYPPHPPYFPYPPYPPYPPPGDYDHPPLVPHAQQDPVNPAALRDGHETQTQTVPWRQEDGIDSPASKVSNVNNVFIVTSDHQNVRATFPTSGGTAHIAVTSAKPGQAGGFALQQTESRSCSLTHREGSISDDEDGTVLGEED